MLKHYESLHKEDGEIFYTIFEDINTLLYLGKEYGAVKIVSIPELEFLTERNYGIERYLIIVCSPDDINSENIKSILKHEDLLKRYKDTIYLDENDIESYFSFLPSSRSFIIASGINNSSCSMIVSSGIHFALFNINENYSKLMISRGLENYVSDSSAYENFKRDFERAYNEKLKLKTIINDIKRSVITKYNYFPYIYIPEVSIFSTSLENISFYYEFEDSDRLHDVLYYDEFIKTLPYSESGIYLDHRVCETFLLKDRVYYYPWVGILEVIDDQDISYLVENNKFKVSLKYCILLYVLTERIKSFITSYFDINVEVIELPYIKDKEKYFDIEYFKGRPSVVNIGSTINKESLHIFNKERTHIIPRIQGNNKSITERTFLNTITVVSSSYPSPVGIFYDCITLRKPLVIKKKEYYVKILGEDYPLFTHELNRKNIQDILTEENILSAYEIINNINIQGIDIVDSIEEIL